MFHWGFNVPRGSDVLRAIVLRARFFFLNTKVDVVSPNDISRRSEIIFSGTRVWVLYWISNSGSESLSQSHISSLGSAGWRSVAWPDAKFFILLYDRFLFDGLVIIIDNSVLGGLPKCASNGFILVAVFGINFTDSMIFATIVAKSDGDHNGSCSITDIRRFIVWIKRSTIPVALWSPAGANISFMFCYFKRFHIRVLWKPLLGHMLLIEVWREIGNTLIGSLAPFRRRKSLRTCVCGKSVRDLLKLV